MKFTSNKPLYLAIASIVLFLATLALVNLNNNFDSTAVLTPTKNALKVNGFLLPKTLPLAGIEFTSTSELLKSTADFENKWTLLALGYTQCPDVCPTTLLKLDHVLNDIPLDERPQVAFLSIDITAKNIDKLSVYMNYFNEDFIGLSTTTAQLDEFFQSLGASYSIKNSAKGSIDIEHSSSIFLISPDKQYVANFPYMLTADQIRQDYLAIVGQ
jgi:cytochrome oxidase Cu insertion factor (SCO1/SenC/PrrC family)